jgi:hypothetical protein
LDPAVVRLEPDGAAIARLELDGVRRSDADGLFEVRRPSRIVFVLPLWRPIAGSVRSFASGVATLVPTPQGENSFAIRIPLGY